MSCPECIKRIASWKERVSSLNKKNIKFTYQYLKEYKWVWLIGVLFVAIATTFKIKYSWIMKDLIDDALIPKDFSLLTQLCVMFTVYVLISATFTYLKEFCFNYVSQKSITKMRKDIFSHVLTLPYQFYIKNDTGDILSRLIDDTKEAQEAFADYVICFVTNAITAVLVISILFYIDMKLALLVLIIVPVFIVLSKLFWNGVAKTSKKVTEERAEVTGFLQQTIRSIELVKLIGDNNIFISSLEKMCIKWANSTILLRMKRSFANNLWDSILTPYQGIIFFMGGLWYINTGSPTIGTIVAFMNFINLLLPAMIALINDITSMAKGVASIDRLYEYLSEKPETSGNHKLSDSRSVEIEFRNVCFEYKDTGFSINNLNLKIDGGEFVAIVGHTGSGKSTLIKLLIRLYDIDSGQILVNGIDIKDYDIHDLRKSFGFIQQDVHLLKGSIKENLLYSNPCATEDEVCRAINIAQLDSLIASLPNKLETWIGEHGTTLSGGERQRISIARALLKKSKVMVMDEPTSALDLKTERQMLSDMTEVFATATTIAVDHRLATLDKANRILVMSNGCIIEQGTYDELMCKNSELKRIASVKQ